MESRRPEDRREDMRRDVPMDRDMREETRHISGGSGTYRGDSTMPVVRETMPDTYRDDFRDIYRGYRYDRMNKAEKNIFRQEKNYKKYSSEDEIFECIVEHLTKGVKFHDRMMDLYGFLGLYGFKKMHEYQYYSETMNRRKAKCYVIDHMNLLVKEECDEEGLNFIPQSWYGYTRHDITPEARKQYIGPSFQGYKQSEEETKELLSYCANELMYMGKMSDFNEVMAMVDDVEQELNKLEDLILKLKSVDYDIQYIMDMQEELSKEYEDKLEECFEEKLEEDKKKKRYKMMYGMDEDQTYARRRSARTGRYIRG